MKRIRNTALNLTATHLRPVEVALDVADLQGDHVRQTRDGIGDGPHLLVQALQPLR